MSPEGTERDPFEEAAAQTAAEGATDETNAPYPAPDEEVAPGSSGEPAPAAEESAAGSGTGEVSELPPWEQHPLPSRLDRTQPDGSLRPFTAEELAGERARLASLSDEELGIVTPVGVCLACGCTDEEPCEEGCSWVDELQTMCSVCHHKGMVSRMKRPVERFGGRAVIDVGEDGGGFKFTAPVEVDYTFSTKKVSDRVTQVQERIAVPALDIVVNRHFTHTR